MNPGDELAFPGKTLVLDETCEDGKTYIPVTCSGLTKREKFAESAMNGLLSGRLAPMHRGSCIRDAVRFADALLAELAKPREETDAHN